MGKRRRRQQQRDKHCTEVSQPRRSSALTSYDDKELQTQQDSRDTYTARSLLNGSEGDGETVAVAGEERSSDTATSVCLAERLLESGLVRADAFGRVDGNWVFDQTIVQLLEFLSTEAARELTFQRECYEVRVCYVDAASCDVDIPDAETTELGCNQLILVTHTATNVDDTTGYHFSVIICNVQHKLVHVFDTLARWPDKRAKRTLRQLFPSLSLQGYNFCNHTGRLHQRSASCGAWSLWICFAYALNFLDCRLEEGHSRLNIAALQADVVAFWKVVTR